MKKERRRYSRKTDMLLQNVLDNQRETREDVKTLIKNQGEMSGKLDGLPAQCESRHTALKQDILNPKKSFIETVTEMFNNPKKIAAWIAAIFFAITSIAASIKADSAGAQVRQNNKAMTEAMSNYSVQNNEVKAAEDQRFSRVERIMLRATKLTEKFIETMTNNEGEQ